MKYWVFGLVVIVLTGISIAGLRKSLSEPNDRDKKDEKPKNNGNLFV